MFRCAAPFLFLLTSFYKYFAALLLYELDDDEVQRTEIFVEKSLPNWERCSAPEYKYHKMKHCDFLGKLISLN
jgi:hypothetical protein